LRIATHRTHHSRTVSPIDRYEPEIAHADRRRLGLDLRARLVVLSNRRI
jgi:hypothetical protein